MECLVNANQFQKQLETLQQKKPIEIQQEKKKREQEKTLADKIRIELEVQKKLKLERLEDEKREIKESVNFTA